MIDIQIKIHISPNPAQIDDQLQALARWINTLSGQIDVNGAECAETDKNGTDVLADPKTAQTTATTPPRNEKTRKRARLNSEIVDHNAHWAEFDGLVKSEMERLSKAGRMPDTKRWNNERDPRLPTMTNVLLAYDAADLLSLADLLELRPPLSALGVAPYVEVAE